MLDGTGWALWPNELFGLGEFLWFGDDCCDEFDDDDWRLGGLLWEIWSDFIVESIGPLKITKLIIETKKRSKK